MESEVPPKEAVSSRLTLRVNEARIHLLAATTVQLGRARTCDIITRVIRPDGTAPEELNRQISRYHCHFKMQNNQCELVDRGWDPDAHRFRPSSYGTFVNGQRIIQGESHPCADDIPFVVSLAKGGPVNPNIVSFDARLWAVAKALSSPLAEKCWNTYNGDDLACLTLQRRGIVPEVFAVLWKLWLPGTIIPRLSGTCICRSHDGFLIRTAEHCEWVIVGRKINLMNAEIRVEDYNQNGIQQ